MSLRLNANVSMLTSSYKSKYWTNFKKGPDNGGRFAGLWVNTDIKKTIKSFRQIVMWRSSFSSVRLLNFFVEIFLEAEFVT